MYKDGNQIYTDLLHSQDTKESNGVEIYVDIDSNEVHKYFYAIAKQLCYFDNLYLETNIDEYKVFVDSFNNLKIKEFDDFYAYSID